MEKMAEYTKKQSGLCIQNDSINRGLFDEYGVKRGLRDENGKGVLTGLTNISQIIAFRKENGEEIPCDGELLYRGYDVKRLVQGGSGKRFIFEEGAYLLLFGELPDEKQLAEFQAALADCMTLPTNFTRDVIMKAPSEDVMNSMIRSILTLASYDTDKNNPRDQQCVKAVHAA